MSDDDDGGIDRRRLVRILIVLGIGLPILIEAVTFFGLVSHSVGDGNGTQTPTEIPDAVGKGDELLTETSQRERITTASIGESGGDWVFVLTVQVENEGPAPYELRLGTVRTSEGTTVSGAATTGRIEPGDVQPVTGSWTVPAGERPRSVEVTALSYEENGTQTTNATVLLARLPTPEE